MIQNKIQILIILSIITLVGFGLRYFGQIYDNKFSFANDQARDALIIKEKLENKKLFFLGPEIASIPKLGANVHFGPFYYYLMAPAYWISDYKPVAGAVFTIILSVLSIFLIYYLGAKIFSKCVGLITAFLFAVSNLLIEYSFTWNPNPVPFFVILFLLFFYLYVEEKKGLYYFLCFFILGLLTQLHLFTIFLIPIFLITLLIKKVKIYNLKNITCLLGGIVLSYLPMIIFEFKYGFNNFIGYWKIFTINSGENISFTHKFYDNLMIFINYFNQIFTPGFNKIFVIIILLIMIYYSIKNIKNIIVIMMLVTFVVFFILCIVSKLTILNHYLLAFVPILLLIFSASVDYLWDKDYIGKFIAILVLILVVFSNIQSYYIKYFQPKYPVHSSDIQYKDIERSVLYIIEDSNNQKFNVTFKREYIGSNELSYGYLFELRGVNIDPESNLEYVIVQPKNYYVNIPEKISEKDIGYVKIIKVVKHNGNK